VPQPIKPLHLILGAALFLLLTCSAPLAPSGRRTAIGSGMATPRPTLLAAADSPTERPEIRPTTTPAAALVVPTQPATPSLTSNQLTQSIDQYLTTLNIQGGFSGAVLVARDGQIVFEHGYGPADSTGSVLNTEQTHFRLASLTKQFTAMAIMILQQQGKLTVGDPICSYIDNCPEAWKPVTIRHLLNHTSGIIDYTDDINFETTEGLPTTPDQLVSRFRDQPLAYTPGDYYDYCNSGYVLLGVIIERVSGMSYSQFIQEAIFTRLGMSNSGYDASEIFDPSIAFSYRSAGQPTSFLNATTLFSAGGLYSTVGDLFLWDQALYGEQQISRPLLNEMFTPGNGSYGYGWKIEQPNGFLRISHAGNMTGVSNFIARYPDQHVTIIVLSNMEYANSAGVSDWIASQVVGG
jgi:CubicO group peptidase (beta-lactamase class C family)